MKVYKARKAKKGSTKLNQKLGILLDAKMKHKKKVPAEEPNSTSFIVSTIHILPFCKNRDLISSTFSCSYFFLKFAKLIIMAHLFKFNISSTRFKPVHFQKRSEKFILTNQKVRSLTL